jgi:hypothetical protein
MWDLARVHFKVEKRRGTFPGSDWVRVGFVLAGRSACGYRHRVCCRLCQARSVTLEVHTDDLVAAGAALRRLGVSVSSYGHQLDHRVSVVALGVDGEVGSSLTRAWDDVARALDDLADGFETYGRALDEVALRYHEVDSELTIRAKR